MIAFILLGATTLALAVISFGTYAGWSVGIYSSAWMCALWTATALAAVAVLIRRRVYRRPASFAIHASLVLILAGAAVTHFCSESGTLHLRLGELGERSITTDDGGKLPLPFSLSLDRWQTLYYPSTPTPLDFVCSLSATTSQGTQPLTLQMNKATRIDGWQLILDSYDSDTSGVTLRLRHDPVGTAFSFVAYALLGLSMLLYFFDRRSGFRVRLHALRRGAVAVILLSGGVLAADAALPDSFVSEFGSLMVLHNDRIAPVATLASYFTSNVTGGASSWDGQDAEQIFAGFLFDFSHWKSRPLIKVKNHELRRLLGISGSRASYADYMKTVMSGTLDIDNPETTRRFSDDIARFEAVNMLITGELLKIYPVESDAAGTVSWLSPASSIPIDINSDRWLFIRKSLGLLNNYILCGDYQSASELLDSIRRYQVKTSHTDISPARLQAERLYNKLGGGCWLAICCLSSGLLFFIHNLLYGRKFRVLARLVSLAAFVLLTVLIVVRWVISGHVPLANGFETMQFMAWCILVAGLLSSTITPLSLVGGGMCLMVASFSGAAAQVTPLMPALSSPLLSIHVVCVMAAYALFLMAALIAAAALIRRNAPTSARMADIEALLIYPAEFLLAAGIFIGAVWADVSWGVYWNWDPKEVWALITFIVYALLLHPHTLKFLSKPRRYHIFIFMAFVSVLVTYFGVNFFLGGQHSYA